MGRIEISLSRLRLAGQSAFVPFVMAGDPDLSATAEIAIEAARAGAGALEIGIPFSDPMADGPVLQRSAERALDRGVNLGSVLDLVKEMRQQLEIPIILFGYFNPIYSYGSKRLVRDAKAAGVDGLLCVDLPPEEAGELKSASDNAELDLVFLLAPTTNLQRMRSIIRIATGFLYFVSVTGVTGGQLSVTGALGKMVGKVKSLTTLPVGVGFGIATPAQAAQVAGFADAVISGSAVMRVIEQHQRNKKRMLGELGRFFRSMTRAVKSGSLIHDTRRGRNG